MNKRMYQARYNPSTLKDEVGVITVSWRPASATQCVQHLNYTVRACFKETKANKILPLLLLAASPCYAHGTGFMPNAITVGSWKLPFRFQKKAWEGKQYQPEGLVWSCESEAERAFETPGSWTLWEGELLLRKATGNELKPKKRDTRKTITDSAPGIAFIFHFLIFFFLF